MTTHDDAIEIKREVDDSLYTDINLEGDDVGCMNISPVEHPTSLEMFGNSHGEQDGKDDVVHQSVTVSAAPRSATIPLHDCYHQIKLVMLRLGNWVGGIGH